MSHAPSRRELPVVTSFREHERYLWGLCYRLTGSAAEADDLVQETFVRALQRPPARAEEPWRPWLVTVALNLGRDALRKRRRRGYEGPWLPSPVETEGEDAVPSFEVEGSGGTEARYDLLESVSFAFLLALEALTPQQRGVLLLRDVLDYSVEETARALHLSEPSVKTTHHRARRALAPYEATRCRPGRQAAARAGEALRRFLTALASGDAAAVEALLAEDARALSDGGGTHHAARKPVVGRARVARLFVGLTRHQSPLLRWEIRTLNGLPSLCVEQRGAAPGFAPRFVLQCTVDAAGRIDAVYTVLAPDKLSRVRPVRTAADLVR
jgi:RNA polymerase sigma-70 factor (ECF subfamily)